VTLKKRNANINITINVTSPLCS